MLYILTEGDATYYDFKNNTSVYKVVMSEFTVEQGNEFCQKILGVNASLIYFESTDEMDYIKREFTFRGLASNSRFWTKGTIDNTPEVMFSTPSSKHGMYFILFQKVQNL